MPFRSILLVGPDGAGKTALLQELRRHAEASSVRVFTAHYRPGVLFRKREARQQVPDPHSQPTRNILTSLLKVLGTWLDYFFGANIQWRLAQRQGLLIIERGWFDQSVDPKRYRLPSRLKPMILTLGKLVPKPDIALLLEGDPREMHQRKPEIGVQEVERQIAAWKEIGGYLGRKFVSLDTSRSSTEEVAKRVLSERAHTFNWKYVPLAPRRVSLRVSGELGALNIYRPHSRLRKIAFWTWQTSPIHFTTATNPPLDDLPALLNEFDLRATGLAAMKSSTPGRWIIGVSTQRRLGVVVKIGSSFDQKLMNEAQILKTFSSVATPMKIPRLIWSGAWKDHYLLMAEAFRIQPALPDVEVAEEIATYLTNGVDGVGSYLHGDFAPWNLVLSESGWALIDWEAASRRKLPLFDLAYFVIRAGSLLRRHTPKQVVHLLTADGSVGIRHLQAVGEDTSLARELLADHLLSFPHDSRRMSFFVRECQRELNRSSPRSN